MNQPFMYGIGLDQGIASIGWAIVRLDAEGKPVGIERLGVHLFESGTEGDVSSGRDESRAGPRRMARQLRKQYRRRVLRKRRLLRWLQELGLIPPGEVNTPEGRDALLKSLDRELRLKWEPLATTDHRNRQLLPYRLRAAALDARLEPYELGRALYHLAQRRGYLSNRKQQAADAVSGNAGGTGGSDEDASVVREAIVELERQMRGAGCKTIAAYFSKLDPAGTIGQRLRGRWTAREMFLEEFNRICDCQAKHHPALTTEARERLRRAIFFQRPLQSASNLIGKCTLMPGKRRAPLAHRISQRFRLLQQVNNLIIELPDYSQRGLSRDERARLITALQHGGDITFAKLKTKAWFGLPKGSTFNLERGGEKRLVGNRTDAKCRAVFGDARWESMSEEERDAVVNDLIVFEKPAALAKRGQTHWGLTPDKAVDFGDCILESGFASHCVDALRVLVSRMEDGTPYATARNEEFGQNEDSGMIVDLLPPVEAALGDLRNPAVTRALTELRKLTNAIVRHYGKPAWIRLELARDLKQARKHRERLSREMRAQEDRRDVARGRVLTEAGVASVSRDDLERVLLADECGWMCPYTGRAFGMRDIVGRSPQVDVEHIWPLSRSLDNSFLNKTLCFVEENRNVKKNRTPFEAYSGMPERWSQIIDRIKRFRGDAARIKLERFIAPVIPDGFAQRHLVETRKIGAASAAYLGLLYGGEIDAQRRRRVFVTTGGLTAHLRREWHLNGLLDDGEQKTREDHRHHAIDALVIALTDTRTVQSLQVAAEQASAVGRRMFAPMDEPWPGFVDAARDKVAAINVSHRQSRRIAGKLHAETNYSRPTGPNAERRVRKVLEKLSEKELDRIVDPVVRKAVRDRIAELGLKPKGAGKQYTDFSDPATHPFTLTRSGQKNWIHKVRVVVHENPRSVGLRSRERFVTSTPGSNHHIVLQRQADGRWTDHVVPLIEVLKTPPSTDRPHGGPEFTLAANDFVLLRDKTGKEALYRVLSVSEGDIELIGHCDARPTRERKADRIRGGASALLKRGLRKVTVTYLGEVRRAGG